MQMSHAMEKLKQKTKMEKPLCLVAIYDDGSCDRRSALMSNDGEEWCLSRGLKLGTPISAGVITQILV